MTTFSPREIVSELDRFIVGQDDAKRAVAIALRNRWRRMQLDAGLRNEVMPPTLHVGEPLAQLDELLLGEVAHAGRRRPCRTSWSTHASSWRSTAGRGWRS